MLLERFLFESMLFYGIFETVFFLISLFLTIKLYLIVQKQKTTILQYLFYFYICYTCTIFFSALLKYVWHFVQTLNLENYFIYLYDEGVLVYIPTLLGNFMLYKYTQKIFSKRKIWIDYFMGSFAGLAIILQLIPPVPSIFLDSLVLFQYILVSFPGLIRSYKFKSKINDSSRYIMQSFFYFILTLNFVWISNILDAIWDLVIPDLTFGPFYYLIWVFGLISLIIAYIGIIQNKAEVLPKFIPYQFLSLSDQEEKPLTKPLDVIPSETPFSQKGFERILISCPLCNTTTYFSLTPELKEKCAHSPSGITSVFIRRGLICKHSFLIYIDKEFHIRRTGQLDYTTDLDLLLQHLPDAFIHFNKEYSIIDFMGNENFLNISKNDVIGKSLFCRNLIPSTKKYQKYINNVFSQQSDSKIEYTSEINGLAKNFEVRLIPTSKETALAIIRDITEQKALEARLLTEQVQHQKLNSLSLLAGGIAHDFNNYLVSILGSVNLLQFSEEKLSEEGKELIQDLENATQKAKELTQQLLTFSKHTPPNKQLGSLSQVLQQSISISMRGSKSKCITEFPANIPQFYFDQGQLYQVFNNLLINAKQAMPQGGIITVRVKQTFDKIPEFMDTTQDYILIEFHDEGKGIPKKIQEHIFEPYYTTKKTGTGLGLATCYTIIKNHKGYITFTSECQKGTKFLIYLPIITKI